MSDDASYTDFLTVPHHLEFLEVEAAELSTVRALSGNDGWASERKCHAPAYVVQTVSLEDLLVRHSAPKVVDYLSVDTEGSEFEILSAFDFSAYTFRAVSIEHNFMPVRAAIYKLMTRNGYQRVLSRVSAWDDWYVHDSVLIAQDGAMAKWEIG